MKLRSIAELAINKGSKVLVRVDYNIPVNDEGTITDDARIKGTIDTLKYILEKGGIPIILSHWGRPESGPRPDMSLARVVPELQKLLEHPVNFLIEPLGDSTKASVAAAKPGDVFLIENLRFHSGERKIDPEFAKALSEYADFYVNDAFPVSHRSQTSVSVLPTFFKDPAAGFSLIREVDYFSKVVFSPERPYVLIIGGKKVEDKIGALRFLLEKTDEVLVGGGSCYTVLAARGYPIGHSVLDKDLLDEIDDIADSPKVKTPVDHIASTSYSEPQKAKVVTTESFPDDMMGLDIGPQTRKAFIEAIRKAKTILWFGPLGAYEEKAFSVGSREVAQAMAEVTKEGTTTVTGGGDSLAMLKSFGLEDSLSHASIGGGACLHFLEGKELPGITPLIA
ncbi:phosphoglycerate kinase [bacterium]|nr:phosphoglycerate kinase [bacterium]